MIKARVFISCGQSTAEEKGIGNACVDYFKVRGFEPYFAEEVHSPLGLTQNIFESLKRRDLNYLSEAKELGRQHSTTEFHTSLVNL